MPVIFYMLFLFGLFRDGVSGTIYPCHIVPASPDTLCEMKTLEVLASRPYIINITAINALGSATKLMSFDLEENGEGL